MFTYHVNAHSLQFVIKKTIIFQTVIIEGDNNNNHNIEDLTDDISEK